MKKRGLLPKRILSAGLGLALMLGAPVGSLAALSSNGLSTVQAASAVTRSSIHDGAILHAFCWNFNTIKENMADIAAAGYTAVQTSPINECLAIHPGMALYGETEDEGRWYYHYQPTDWKIGNYQLGSRDEFKAMCDEADKYGIGVIVDIAPNHTTPVYEEVSDDLKAAAGGEDALYHIGTKVEDGDQGGMRYDDRISVTYDAMGGLPDVDTENAGFQQYFYEFLEDCIDCGADGFRIDTAKHIALPDDGVAEEYAGQEGRNNFFPNMKSAIDAYGSKDYADLFVYGEVLDGDVARLAAYQDMLGGTVASNYGGAIRNAVSSGSVSVKKLQNYKISDDTSTGTTYTADSNKLVTWVESHDNYINDNTYREVDDREVLLGWAIIAAREDGTPLFFSRPDGSDASNPWGNNRMGVAGSDIYKAPEVAAVNKFRTAMEGQVENLRNPGNNSSVLMIERGDKGVVIVNAGESDFTLDSQTNLADGTYLDSVKGEDNLYTVADGQISGTIPAKSVVVLYELADGDYSTLFFHNTDNWSSVSAVVGDKIYSCENQGYSWWKVTIPEKTFKVKFVGDDKESAEFSISETSGRYMTAKSKKLYGSKAEAEESLNITTKTIYFLNSEEWKSVNAYAWIDEPNFKELFGGWPGQACDSDEGYWVRATVKMIGDSDFNIIFNGDGGQTVNIGITKDADDLYIVPEDKNGNGNFEVSRYTSRKAAEEATGIGADSITVYYYNACDWDTVGVYTWGDLDLGGWPGLECEYEGDGWWKKTINATPSSNLNIIFNNHVQGDDGKRQTEDMKADSLKTVYFIGAKYKYTSKEAALYALEHDDLKLEKNLHPELDPKEETEKKLKDIEEEVDPTESQTKVYIKLDVDKFPEGAYFYAWKEGVGDVDGVGGWPGLEMTHIGNGWHSVNIPSYLLQDEKGDLAEVELAEEDLEEELAEDELAEEKLVEEDALEELAEISDEEPVEESVEDEAENKSAVDEIVDAVDVIIEFVSDIVNPTPEVVAAEHKTFIDGIHVIVNNNDGYQEDDVNERVTTYRPSDEELKQVEETVEPAPAPAPAPAAGGQTGSQETPTPAPAPASSSSQPSSSSASSSSSSSSSASSSSASSISSASSQTAQQSAAVANSATPATIADAQTPLAAPEVQVAQADTSKTNKTGKTVEKAEDTKLTDEITEEKTELENTTTETVEQSDETELRDSDSSDVSIQDTETPLVADASTTNPATVVGIIIAALLALSAAGVVVYRTRK